MQGLFCGKRVFMRKIYLIAVLLLSCIIMAGCGGKELPQNNLHQFLQENGESAAGGIPAEGNDLPAPAERTEYYEIAVDAERIFDWEQEGEEVLRALQKAEFLGMQFYQGEPVQLWQEPNRDQYGFLTSWDVCLYRADGSRVTLLQGIEADGRHYAYLDQEGNLYWWANSSRIEYPDGGVEEINGILRKYSSAGELIFERQYDYGMMFREMREIPEGRVYLIFSKIGAERDGKLAELDPATGLVTELDAVRLTEQDLSGQKLGVWGDRLARFKFGGNFDYEIAVMNTADGSEESVFSSAGTSYMPPENYTLCDYRALEDESVETLWRARDGSKSLRQVLRMEKGEKIPIVLRGHISAVSWFSKQINSFNQQNETYHVIVEDDTGDDLEELARLTSVQIASGKGPDILCGGLMKEYIPGMLEKGALEDLRPFMEKSGIREEDFFPFTFDTWRSGDKICGISPASPSLTGYCMDSSVLGGTEEPDIEALTDALLAGQEKAIFLKRYDSGKLLELLLRGTETLWGMVDWENRSCDFNGELFQKLLEVAKRYGDDGNPGEISCIAERRSLGAIQYFDDRQEREENGKVICGVLFDDGCHAAVEPDSALAINANSSNKEGAWEFISFLLGEEAQSGESGVPVSRKGYDAWVERQKKRFAGGKREEEIHCNLLPDGSYAYQGTVVYTEADVADEIIEEYTEMMEDTRTYSLRTAPILAIIREEAEDYFQGNKSPEEVSRLITNRVQLYLDEMQ